MKNQTWDGWLVNHQLVSNVFFSFDSFFFMESVLDVTNTVFDVKTAI